MIFKEGLDFKNYAKEEIDKYNVKHSRDFSDILKKDYILRKNTTRGVLITGLRSTGKTMGVYQAVLDFPSDNIFFLSASYRNELSKTEVLEKVKQKEYDLIFIDEYSWFSENKWDRDDLSGYLAGKSMEGVKVIISGTDSTKIHSLLCTDFIHRAVELNTTYFSYDEYCRLFELKKNDGSMKSFLTQGGIFENRACDTYGSMRNYIKSAIIENLGAYYPQFNKDVIEAAVYKIFYECICKSYTKNAESAPIFKQGRRNTLAYEELLENFGIRSDVQIKRSVLKEIFYKLKEIGVVVILDDIKLNNRERAYITNQTISAQLTKYIYELDELPETYMGDLFEASVVCYEYMQYVFDVDSPYKIFYAETRKSDLEIDFILCDKRKAYLFECKLNNNDDIQLNDTASILQNRVVDFLGDRDLGGRYLIYQGKEKCIEKNGCTVVCTNNWDVDFEHFDRNIERIIGKKKKKEKARNLNKDIFAANNKGRAEASPCNSEPSIKSDFGQEH